MKNVWINEDLSDAQYAYFAQFEGELARCLLWGVGRRTEALFHCKVEDV